MTVADMSGKSGSLVTAWSYEPAGEVDIWADSMVNMFAPLVTSEIGMEKSGSPVCVKGRLKQNVEFWKNELKAPPTVISTIEAGYVLPLLSEPPQSFQKNQFSAKVRFRAR